MKDPCALRVLRCQPRPAARQQQPRHCIRRACLDPWFDRVVDRARSDADSGPCGAGARGGKQHPRRRRGRPEPGAVGGRDPREASEPGRGDVDAHAAGGHLGVHQRIGGVDIERQRQRGLPPGVPAVAADAQADPRRGARGRYGQHAARAVEGDLDAVGCALGQRCGETLDPGGGGFGRAALLVGEPRALALASQAGQHRLVQAPESERLQRHVGRQPVRARRRRAGQRQERRRGRIGRVGAAARDGDRVGAGLVAGAPGRSQVEVVSGEPPVGGVRLRVFAAPALAGGRSRHGGTVRRGGDEAGGAHQGPGGSRRSVQSSGNA